MSRINWKLIRKQTRFISGSSRTSWRCNVKHFLVNCDSPDGWLSNIVDAVVTSSLPVCLSGINPPRYDETLSIRLGTYRRVNPIESLTIDIRLIIAFRFDALPLISSILMTYKCGIHFNVGNCILIMNMF